MKLYLIRHAQTPSNVNMVIDTTLPGPPLTDLGHQQAAALAEELANHPLSAVYASRAIRAQQTATPLAVAHSLDLQLVDGVQEVFAGGLEGRTDLAAMDEFRQVAQAWMRGDLHTSMPGDGESGTALRIRFTNAVAQIRAKHEQADPDGVVALVSHSGAIRFGAEWLANNIRPEIANKGLIPNAGFVVLETLPDGGWRCLDWAGMAM